jgi:redox-sensitive bicupin YhaK (pirin superfamily)
LDGKYKSKKTINIMNAIKRLHRVYNPPAQPGFLGNGHTARPVIQIDFSESDPFILFMDDILDKKDDEPVGGPHPHAGFETVTLVIEGELGDGSHKMKAGDFEMMTAGSGVVHTETITKKTKLRILQLWLNLPKKDRWAQPRIQKFSAEHVPSLNKNGVKIKVYSGSFSGLSSPVQNHTSIIIADIKIDAGKSLRELIPGHFTTFIYVLKGSVKTGDNNAVVAQDQVGWFDRSDDSLSTLQLQAGHEGTHLVLYSAEPQDHQIVSHGPFIADSMDEIRNLYADYRQGKIQHINDVTEDQKILL